MTSEKIKNIFDINNNDLFFVISSKPGSGIVTEIKKFAKTSNINFFDLRLAQTEIGDIEGLPFIGDVKSRPYGCKDYTFLIPSWWPTDTNSKGILLFDEIWRANNDVFEAVCNICLDRQLNGLTLPAGWKIVVINND